MKKVIVDIGSSTVKVYKYEGQKLELVLSKSFHFKEHYTPERGLHFNDEEGLIRLLERVNANYFNYQIEAVATGVFRKLSQEQLQGLQSESRKRAKIEIKIISHEDENRFLEKALVGRAKIEKPILLLNIGGSTTELILAQNGQIIDRQNLELGIGQINGQFPEINSSLNTALTARIKQSVLAQLPKMAGSVAIAIFSGGEETFMERLGYPLVANHLFIDQNHRKLIGYDEFCQYNELVLYLKNIEELEKFYPENPEWVNGSRACELIAEVVFGEYGIKYIIPSDANLVHGIITEQLEQ